MNITILIYFGGWGQSSDRLSSWSLSEKAAAVEAKTPILCREELLLKVRDDVSDHLSQIIFALWCSMSQIRSSSESDHLCPVVFPESDEMKNSIEICNRVDPITCRLQSSRWLWMQWVAIFVKKKDDRQLPLDGSQGQLSVIWTTKICVSRFLTQEKVVFQMRLS